ncbi:Nsf, partial [Symbiodinium microadriaticum]
MYPTSLAKEMGFSHVKGILLYGPPGCGKTLIARKIGQALNAREPKIVNGPEVLDKYVGGSEEKIRALFADAEQEMAEMGEDSMLHIIIFDELDAIMKTRGSTRDNTGVNDSIVNQLLSKMDGVESLNNILIIGMTNRLDMIDEAILRPGRMEVHVEIGLPDEHGREQILRIHTGDMRSHGRLTEAAIEHMPEIVVQTKNFTGAELAGLVRSAVSFALSRNIDAKELKADWKSIAVDAPDFDKALLEVLPAFGQKNNEELTHLYRNGIVDYGAAYSMLNETLLQLVNQSRVSERTPLMTVLLEGARGTGKTAIAAKLAVESDFPLIRLISADAMIGMHDAAKCQLLLK